MSENACNGITGMKGRNHSDITKRNMSESAKRRGLTFTEEQRKKAIDARRNMIETPEAKKRRGEAISKAKKGKSNGHEGMRHSEETKAKIAAQKGWKHSDETKAKMSKIVKERCADPEYRKKMSDQNKGKPWSEARRMAYLNKRETK
jgi:hypothetical protein